MVKISFSKLLKQRRAWYKTIKKIYCPLLKNWVVFNSKGFYHLRYTTGGKMRKIKEQHYKLGLLPLVIPAIRNAKRIYKYQKLYSKTLGKDVEFWALREWVGRQKTTAKVILRKIGSGNITFFSVMKKNDRNKKTTRKK